MKGLRRRIKVMKVISEVVFICVAENGLQDGSDVAIKAADVPETFQSTGD